MTMEINIEKTKTKKTAKETSVEEYQCSGCISGHDINCGEYEKDRGCKSHYPGTTISQIGKIFLGLPAGFNRTGVNMGEKSSTRIYIFDTFDELNKDWEYDKFNVPSWKYLNENDHTLVRGWSPRINQTWIHIILEDCMNSIGCYEITKKDVKEMD